MYHDPREQIEGLVTIATAALLKLPDEERAALLSEMHTVVFKRAAEAYGLWPGARFATAFANAVGRRISLVEETW